MKITNSINQLTPSPGSNVRRQEQNVGFAEVLRGMLDSANDLQKHSDEVAEAFVIGRDSVEIHDVVLAAEKARLALDLTVAVRNKLVEAYQEIMRMQI
ncbi:MAG: flagellar hook-basal body complex protein FliE [Firmicutes bacterium]|nr:flagellar hook-basal body complex protein FliE [Bacillota bacterium]